MTFGSDPVVSCEAVQLHLAAADSICEIRVRLTLHLLPVHAEVWPSERPTGSSCYIQSFSIQIMLTTFILFHILPVHSKVLVKYFHVRFLSLTSSTNLLTEYEFIPYLPVESSS